MKLFVESNDINSGEWTCLDGVMRHYAYNQEIKLKNHLKSVQVVQAKNDRTASGTAAAATLGAVVAGPLGAVAGAVFGGKRDKEAVVICELSDGKTFVAKLDGGYLPSFLALKTTKTSNSPVIEQIPKKERDSHADGRTSDFFITVAVGILFICLIINTTLFFVVAGLMGAGIIVYFVAQKLTAQKNIAEAHTSEMQWNREREEVEEEIKDRQNKWEEIKKTEAERWEQEQEAARQGRILEFFEKIAPNDPEMLSLNLAFSLVMGRMISMPQGGHLSSFKASTQEVPCPRYTFDVDLDRAAFWLEQAITELMHGRESDLEYGEDNFNRSFRDILGGWEYRDPSIDTEYKLYQLFDDPEMQASYDEVLDKLAGSSEIFAKYMKEYDRYINERNAEWCKEPRYQEELLDKAPPTWSLLDNYMTLAKMHIVGIGGQKDIEKAAELFDKVIERAHKLNPRKKREQKIREFALQKERALRIGRAEPICVT